MIKRAIIFILIILSIQCQKYKYYPECENPILLKYAIFIEPIKTQINVGDTIKLSFRMPFIQYNYASGDSTNLSSFNKIWLAFQMFKIEVPDGTSGLVAARDKFHFSSSNLKLDYTDGTGARANSRVRYVLDKQQLSFVGDISIVPMQKGLYYIKSMDGLIDDACAFTSVVPFWGNYSVDSVMKSWERIVNRPLNDGELRRPISDWQSDFYFLVN